MNTVQTTQTNLRDKTLMIAPMMQYTDRHFRYLMRLLTQHAILFTEMITAEAIIHTTNRESHLDFSPIEQPLILQIGGNDPNTLAQAATIANHWGYNGINLNAGCPSTRVQSGSMGACMMKDANNLARCYQALCDHFNGPVSIKTRIGVDEYEGDSFLHDLIHTLVEAGCNEWIIHARKAWLKGLNPKQNRNIPPLDYDCVKRLTIAFPKQQFHLNGGIQNTEEALTYLKEFSGIMIGRAAVNNPLWVSTLSQHINPNQPTPLLNEVLSTYTEYVTHWCAYDPDRNLQRIIKPLMGLTHKQPNARHIRCKLAELMLLSGRSVQHTIQSRLMAINQLFEA
jgi:tRNA-dihydrouridine synthase A